MLLNTKRMWNVDKFAWGNLIAHIHICVSRCTIALPFANMLSLYLCKLPWIKVKLQKNS